jgi:hypothetical protein
MGAAGPSKPASGLRRFNTKPRAGSLAERVGELQGGQSCPGIKGSAQGGDFSGPISGCRMRRFHSSQEPTEVVFEPGDDLPQAGLRRTGSLIFRHHLQFGRRCHTWRFCHLGCVSLHFPNCRRQQLFKLVPIEPHALAKRADVDFNFLLDPRHKLALAARATQRLTAERSTRAGVFGWRSHVNSPRGLGIGKWFQLALLVSVTWDAGSIGSRICRVVPSNRIALGCVHSPSRTSAVE